jgi:peptide/nickel transport system permease protein
MRAYLIRRLLLMIPSLFLVTLIVFFMMRLIPGNIIDSMVAEMPTGTTKMDRVALERILGLDTPVHIQYGRWLGIVPGANGSFNGVFQGNLGNSLWSNIPVLEEIANRWPVTFELSLMALIVSVSMGLPIGIYSALRQDTWGDYIARSFAIACIAIPYFWLATLVMVFPSIWWGYMPPITLIPFTEDPIGNLKMFIIPATVLGMALSGITMRMTRTMMLEVLRQDYVRTAWAKGLMERVVIIRHALKNALIPVVTIIGGHLATLIGGTVIIEQIFCLPGMGSLIIDAVHYRDYPKVSGALLFFGAGMMLTNLMIDLIYAYLDRRVSYR